MRFLFLSIQFLPYWAIPMGLIFLEVAFVMKKRENRPLFLRLGFASAFFFLLTLCFFVFRWDQTLYPFLRERLLTH